MIIFAVIFLFEFVQFECLPISLKMEWVIMNFCHAIMPCPTFCHSDLVADRHCLKFHGRFGSDESSRSCCKCVTSATSPSYTICIVLNHSLRTNHPTFHQVPWRTSRRQPRGKQPKKPKRKLTVGGTPRRRSSW